MIKLLKTIRQTSVSKPVLEKVLHSFQVGSEISGRRTLDCLSSLAHLEKAAMDSMAGTSDDCFGFLVKH